MEMDYKANESEEIKTIPYFVHESEVARHERTVKRLWILCIIIFLAFVASNAYWIWYESQWQDVVVTQENADGYNNYIGNSGDIFNGGELGGKTDSQNQTEENRGQ